MKSLRDGSSTPNRLTIRNSLRHSGDLHLVLPSIQDDGILIMAQQVRLMMLSLKRVVIIFCFRYL